MFKAQIYLVLYFLLALAFTGGLGAQAGRLQRVEVYLHEGDTIQGYGEVSNNFDLLDGIRYRADVSANTDEFIAPDKASGFAFKSLGLIYRRVSINWPEFYPQVVEGEHAFGQLVYADDDFELVYLPITNIERGMGKFSDVDYSYVIIDKASGRQRALLKEYRRVGRSKVQLIESFRGVLTYLMSDWQVIDIKARQVRFTDRSLMDLLLEYGQRKYGGHQPIYVFDPNEGLSNVNRHLVQIGSTPGAALKNNRGPNVTLAYVYRHNRPSKNKVFLHLGLEYTRLKLAHVDASSTRSLLRRDALNLKLGLYRHLYVAKSGFKIGGLVALSNYTTNEATIERTFEDVRSPIGNIERVQTAERTTQTTGFMPGQFNVELSLEYRKLAFSVFLEDDLLLNGIENKGLLYTGLRAGFYL